MTKTAFLAALRSAIQAKNYPWAEQHHPNQAHRTKLENFLIETEHTLSGASNVVSIDSPSFVEAWRAIGGKGKPTYKALRALPQ